MAKLVGRKVKKRKAERRANTELYQLALRKHYQPLPHLIPDYERLHQAVAECVRVDEAKKIKDVAEMLQAYARQRHDIEAETNLSLIKLRAYRRIGEIAVDLEKVPHGPGRGRKSFATAGKSFVRKAATLKAANISTSAAHRAERLARIPQAEIDRHVTQAIQDHRPVRIEELLRSVSRERQLRPLRRGSDYMWRDFKTALFGMEGGELRPAGKMLLQMERWPPEDQFEFILVVLADYFASRNLLLGANEYRQLLLRLLQGDFIEAVVHRLTERQPQCHKFFFRGLLKRKMDELEQFLAVDWSETAFGEPAAEIVEEEEVSPAGESEETR
jgi:hypothetical protein